MKKKGVGSGITHLSLLDAYTDSNKLNPHPKDFNTSLRSGLLSRKGSLILNIFKGGIFADPVQPKGPKGIVAVVVFTLKPFGSPLSTF